MDRSRNIQKIQELRKEMKEKEAEHVKAIQKYAAEIESRKGQVRRGVTSFLNDHTSDTTVIFKYEFLQIHRLY